MGKTELTKEMVEAFLMHPDWLYMREYIKEHFDNSTTIDSIDVSNPSTTVHAEVIARQHIKDDVDSLMANFDNAKVSYNKVKRSYE